MSSVDIDTKIKTPYPQGHTFRYRYCGNDICDRGTIEMSRPHVADDLIPITDVDCLLTARDIYSMSRPNYYYRSGSFNLEKRELFNDFIEACEEFATEKKVVHDYRTGLDKYVYVVPIVDHLNLSKTPCREDIAQQTPCQKKDLSKPPKIQSKKNKKRSWRYYEMKKKQELDMNFVVIDGNRYNSSYLYKRTATGFVPITNHSLQMVDYGADESVMRSKVTISKSSVTLTFPKDSTVNGIVLHPEPMKFEYVYETRGHGRSQYCHFIRVLENDPDYIQKFMLYYRSSNTNGQWVEHGIFDGNTSMFASTKIKFDEIYAKELRLVPITHTGSFDKISVTALTHVDKRCDDAEDDSVTYTVFLSHGKYRHDYSRVMDTISSGCDHVCGCFKCVGRKNKGYMKSRRREFIDQCIDD